MAVQQDANRVSCQVTVVVMVTDIDVSSTTMSVSCPHAVQKDLATGTENVLSTMKTMVTVVTMKMSLAMRRTKGQGRGDVALTMTMNN